MENALTQAAISQYRHHGFHFPQRGIGAAKAQAARADLEAYEASLGGPLTAQERTARYKLHVKLPWAHAIVSDASILDAIEALIGPDILVFTSTMFVKEPNTDAVTLWHQDAAYFGLRPHEHVTAWVALSAASEVAGCMTFISQQGAPRLFHHKVNADANSINGAGQTIVEAFDQSAGVRATLKAGEFSLHHTLCAHSSPPNASSDRRIGLGISYVPTRVQHIGTIRMRAMLVRGDDRFGHFEHEPAPAEDALKNQRQHDLSTERYMAGYAEQMIWHEEGRLREVAAAPNT
jgi:non-heme Fe2+,alpha-ketoglutarate-dependent halogenase